VKLTATNHGLSEAELIRVMSATALVSGFAPELADALEKAGDTEHRPTETYMVELVERMEREYNKVCDMLGDNLGRWFAAQFGEKRRWVLLKAMPNLQLTPQQIEELRLLIESHFQPAFIPAVQGVVGFGPIAVKEQPAVWGIPTDVWERWQAEGIVVEGMPVPDIANAYTAGRLYQIVHEGTTFQEMLKLAAAVPLTRPQVLGIAWAETHAASYITKFGQGLASKAVGQVLTVNQRVARTLIGRYLDGTLTSVPATKVPAHNLTPEERDALASDRVVTSWRGVASELFKQFKGTDARRDWSRVAVSETRLAFNAGRLEKMEEQGVSHVYFMVRDTACPHCRRVYLHPNGEPRIFPIKELMDNVMKTGGVNVGRKASLIGKPGGWLPNLLTHPWCRCLPLPYTGHAPFGPAKGV
jgi:hypothetical protein